MILGAMPRKERSSKQRARTLGVREPIPSPAEIKAARGALSIAQAAARVGVKPSTWYGWETPSQHRRPSPSHAILIRLLRSGKLP
jgi:DNA-binding transcriptional regulator YiaG